MHKYNWKYILYNVDWKQDPYLSTVVSVKRKKVNS